MKEKLIGKAFKIHHFVLNKKKSHAIGEQFKGKSGLYQIASENVFIYDCPRCFSTIQLDKKVVIAELNVEMAQKFQCI